MTFISSGAIVYLLHSTVHEHDSGRGTIYVGQGSSLFADDIRCHHNNAISGGCIYGDIASDIRVNRSVFTSNQATNGAMAYLKSAPTIIHSVIKDCLASSYGGAMLFEWSSSLSYSFINLTIMNNIAYGDGGAVYFSSSCALAIPSARYFNNRVIIRGVAYPNNVSSGECTPAISLCCRNLFSSSSHR
jgi:predicted outer membrane repeat protein